jgi:hypothetical protein
LERGLDGGRDELRGLGVDDDVPAGEGPVASGSVTPGTVEETVLARPLDTPELQRLYDDHRAAPARSGAPPVIVSPAGSRQG